jgi:hypothetical protein
MLPLRAQSLDAALVSIFFSCAMVIFYVIGIGRLVIHPTLVADLALPLRCSGGWRIKFVGTCRNNGMHGCGAFRELAGIDKGQSPDYLCNVSSTCSLAASGHHLQIIHCTIFLRHQPHARRLRGATATASTSLGNLMVQKCGVGFLSDVDVSWQFYGFGGKHWSWNRVGSATDTRIPLVSMTPYR